VRISVVCICAGLCQGAVQTAVPGLFRDEPWDWGDFAVWTVGWALMYAGLRWFLGLMDPAERKKQELLSRAVLSGELPPDIEPEVARTELTALRRQQRSVRWVVLGLPLGVAILLGADAVITDGNSDPVWAVALLVGLVGIAGFTWLDRRIVNIERLLRRLPA
jgi:hypothetical protein